MLENVPAVEAKKPATLFVATPMYGGMCVGGYTMGILNCTQEFMKHGIKMYYSYMMNESLIPVLALALGLADNLAELGKAVSDAMSRGLPDAPEWVRRIPLLGHWLHDYWQRLAHDGQRLMAELNKFAKPAQDMALTAGTV